MKHCCDKIKYYTDEEYTKEHELIEYNAYSRSYYLLVHGDDYGLLDPLVYCPWCGKKLPKKLNMEWSEMVEKELGLKSVWDIEWKEIPDKYKTDEWWKKRGL